MSVSHFPEEDFACPDGCDDEIARLRAALDEANTRRRRLAEQLALRDQACVLGGQEVIYERTRADRAVAQVQRVEAWRDQLIANRGGWDADIGQHLTELLAGQDNGDSDGA